MNDGWIKNTKHKNTTAETKGRVETIRTDMGHSFYLDKKISNDD